MRWRLFLKGQEEDEGIQCRHAKLFETKSKRTEFQSGDSSCWNQSSSLKSDRLHTWNESKSYQKKVVIHVPMHLNIHPAFLLLIKRFVPSVSVCLSSVEYDFRQQERHLMEVLNHSPRGNKAFSAHLARSLNISMLRNTIKNLTKSRTKSKKLCKTLFKWLPGKIQQR